MRRLLSLGLSYCILGSFSTYGWWETGHQVIARIATAHLTPTARTRIARILEVPDSPASVADALAKASIWADETKAQTGTGNWHFIDLTLEDQKTDIPLRCKDDNCAPARIAQFATQLKNRPADTRWSQLDALRYLVHLVGDIHQPLHTISDADLGGNCERLDPPVDTARNLHALWDGGIIRAMEVDDRALTASLEQQIEALPFNRHEELVMGSQDDWVWESHGLAIQDVYYKLHIPLEPAIFPANCGEAPAVITDFKPQIDSLYVDNMKPLVREQLIKGGLRLAKMLNDAL